MKNLKDFIFESNKEEVIDPIINDIINYMKNKSFFKNLENIEINKDKNEIILSGDQEADEPDDSNGDPGEVSEYNHIYLNIELKNNKLNIITSMSREYYDQYFTDEAEDEFSVSKTLKLDQIIKKIEKSFNDLESESGAWYGSSLFGNY